MNPTFLYVTHLHARIKEVWLPTVSFSNYEVSSEGNVRMGKDTIEPTLNKNGLWIVELKEDNGKPSRENVDRLVARAFWPNPDGLPTVVHIDGNKQNNNITNLKWASKGEATAYIISYKRSDGTFQVWNSHTSNITTESILPRDIKSRFIMLSHNDNEATDEDLLEYAANFKRWAKELHDSPLKIDYSNYYSDYTAVTCVFNRFSKRNYANHEPISTTEYSWFERCANYGLQYIAEKDTVTDTWSYDFKNQYGLILDSQTEIPTKEGTEVTLKKLPKHLDTGFYRVAITSTNEHFRKMFAFSKHNVYLKESLEFAQTHSEKYDVQIELIQDGQPNAYVYDSNDTVSLNSITHTWFSNLTNLRKTLKDNRLLKHLISSCWGHLNANNKIYKTWEEIEDEELSIGNSNKYDYQILKYFDYGDRECYELLNTKSPYKHNIRLKPWITACARNLTASIVLNDIKRVVRVQTDSVSFTREQEFDDPNLVPEEKTTGTIHWKNVNSYKNRTTGYQTKGY